MLTLQDLSVINGLVARITYCDSMMRRHTEKAKIAVLYAEREDLRWRLDVVYHVQIPPFDCPRGIQAQPPQLPEGA